MRRPGLSAYGLSVNRTDTQRGIRGAHKNGLEVMMSASESWSVGTYYPNYGYFRMANRMQDAIHDLYYTLHQIRYRSQDWLWSERRTAKHLRRLHALYARQQPDPAIFMRALTYHASINHVPKSDGDCYFLRPFTDCLTLAATADIERPEVLEKLWASNLPIDMVLMGSQAKNAGLMLDLL